MYQSLPVKILFGASVAFIFIMGIYFMMAAYATSLASDRSVGYLIIQIRLSSLTDSEKTALLDDFNNYRARTKRGLTLDIQRSNAQLDKKNLGSLECASLMINFVKEAKACLDSMGANPIQSAFSTCPPADTIATQLRAQCQIETNWR